MAYTVSQLDTIIATLEAALSKGYAELSSEGGRLVYRSVSDIMTGINYFKNLRIAASNTAAATTPRRQILLSSSKGF